MVNYNNFGDRYQPSVHYGRQNINNRYQWNAMNRAMSYRPCCHSMNSSVFPSYQQTTVSYNTSDSYMKGAVVGMGVNLVTNNWDKIKSAGSWLVNTVKGWFG